MTISNVTHQDFFPLSNEDREELKQRPRGMLLTGLLSTDCTACFLRVLGTTSPGVGPPIASWALYIVVLLTGQSAEAFSQSVFQNDSTYVRLTYNNQDICSKYV